MNTIDQLFAVDVQEVCTVEDVVREVQGFLVVDDLLAFGRSHRWQFKVMQEKGELTEPISKNGWSYKELRDFTTLPDFAKERLVKVQGTRLPIHQFIYGEEIEVEPETVPHEIQTPKVDWGKMGMITLATAGVLAVGAVALGAVSVLATTAVAAATIVDPKLILVLNDGSPEEEMPWVCLCSWPKRRGSLRA